MQSLQTRIWKPGLAGTRRGVRLREMELLELLEMNGGKVKTTKTLKGSEYQPPAQPNTTARARGSAPGAYIKQHDNRDEDSIEWSGSFEDVRWNPTTIVSQ